MIAIGFGLLPNLFVKNEIWQIKRQLFSNVDGDNSSGTQNWQASGWNPTTNRPAKEHIHIAANNVEWLVVCLIYNWFGLSHTVQRRENSMNGIYEGVCKKFGKMVVRQKWSLGSIVRKRCVYK